MAGLKSAQATEATRVEVTGTVESVRWRPAGGLELQLGAGAGLTHLLVEKSAGLCPALFSRIRATALGSAVRRPATGQVPSLNQLQLLTGALVPVVTNVAQLQRLEKTGRRTRCVASLSGLVLAVSSDGRWLAFRDSSGAGFLELNFPAPRLRPGQEIVLESNGTVAGARVRLGNPPVVDNNGIHTMTSRSGRIFLKAGRWPLRLSWFNFKDPHGLEVYYQGPGIPRQKIPDAALFHWEKGGTNRRGRWVPGVRYRCYEGSWVRVPDFGSLLPAKEGTSANFDPAVISRNTQVGLEFSGDVAVPRTGIYTFWTVSDDGSLLEVDDRPPRIEVTGAHAVPAPRVIAPRQPVGPDWSDSWAQVQGTVAFAARQSGALRLDVRSDTGRMEVAIADGSGSSPQLLLHSRIRAVGIGQSDYTTEGERVAATLLVPGLKQIRLLAVSPEQWIDHPLVPIGQLAVRPFSRNRDRVVHIRGEVRSSGPGEAFVVADQTGEVQVETAQPAPPAENPVEVLGQWSRSGTKIVLRCGVYREIRPPHNARTKALPLLTQVAQIKRLSRQEAQQGYPVQIRGVVTTVLSRGVFIQDDTGSIYARWRPSPRAAGPRVGQYWQIEGTTFAQFAPNIRAHQALRLGTGVLPAPKHPTWDELISGGLDTEYVEVQGIVTAVEPDGVILLTHGGKIRLQLPDIQPQRLPGLEDALIRVRGCVVPAKNAQTQQMRLGRLELANAAITIDKPTPAHPFALPLKHVADLLRFNWRAGTFQRVKMAGQILQHRGDEYFMADGQTGVRFIPQTPVKLDPGDLVEVVGFPELGGPSPVLREATVRRLGRAALPRARSLPSQGLLSRQYDSTRVRVKALLTGISHDRSGQVLDLQAGTRGFVARLGRGQGRLEHLLPGSLLELTGVYVGQGGNLASGRNIDSFELLLNAGSDVQVLAQPSWWTIRHTLTVVGGLLLAIAAAAVWITLLQRQVEERSRQLAAEIRRHEHTERRRELEEERSRIARDLHDDLGATLTQIRFLSALESRDPLVPKNSRDRMEQVSEKSREMVSSLDEIVWAVNPANDSLPSLANYLCHFAEEFFRPTPIRCRLDVDEALPPVLLTSDVRHHLYLAIREALNNIAKHAQASEIWLRIQWRGEQLRISLEDNGRGFAPPAALSGGDGLANMRRRLDKIGGRFECETLPGAGSACRFVLPLAATSVGQPPRPV